MTNESIEKPYKLPVVPAATPPSAKVKTNSAEAGEANAVFGSAK